MVFDGLFHVPVLLDEVLGWLEPKPGGRYIDCTVGAGDILEKSSPDGRLLGIDWDPEAIERANQTLRLYRDRLVLNNGPFRDLRRMASSTGFSGVQGVLFDLGLSSIQLMDPERGFSFLADGPLDMRFNRTQGRTASEFLDEISESDLGQILRTFGEERYARRIARAFSQAREHQSIQTTGQLTDIVRRAVPPAYRKGRLHCATRTFQAIRIALNRELADLEGSLRKAVELLTPGGRVCAIAFHSLEDRIVKHTFRSLATGPDPLVTIRTKKPCVPTEDERRRNPRSRSAKLRVAERVREKGP